MLVDVHSLPSENDIEAHCNTKTNTFSDPNDVVQQNRALRKEQKANAFFQSLGKLWRKECTGHRKKLKTP